MRHYDAIKAGKLTVPTHLTSLEDKLRKEWTKNDREVKKDSKAATTSETKKLMTAKTTKATGAKRKADDDSNKSSTSNSTPHRAKKAKTASPSSMPPSKAPSNAKTSASSRAKPTASITIPDRGGSSRGYGRDASITATSVRSRAVRQGGVSQATRREVSAIFPSSGSRFQPRQTARRSRPFFGRRGRIPAPRLTDQCHDDYDDLYEDYISQSSDDHDNGDASPSYPDSEHDEDTYGEDIALTPLKYINGRYTISCPYAADNWPQYGSNYSLVFAISGSSLWASFDFGIVEGVMYFLDSPTQLSCQPVPFKWRGRETEGSIVHGDHNEGWIKFLGGGQLEGQLCYQHIAFRGQRRAGPATASPIDALTMQNRWNKYSQQEYEREELARWH
ncbi:hypothetical protein FOCG_00007 [Fusarium oxysporum f. sp. radicis-lycopersici 26381]|nr:hypothetical protein FOCG_00007 [Fusarium oxysporum f. sp. radicis-lycopersici 26381]